MRFNRIRIQNFKCYAESELQLRTGVTVVHGVNGSGKSSLLEACFFALYGAAAIDSTLDDVISNDADELAVELWFSHAERDYRVHREVKRRGDTAQTTTCLLETPTETIEQVTSVETRIQELLRMDADAFVNCAYVRQGEVNKLINASPAERQDMIDDLLQLGKLEDYRSRASDARVGVGRVRDDKQGSLTEVQSQIEAKEAKELHSQLADLQTGLQSVEDDIDEKEANRQTAQQTLEDAERVIEESADRREELATIDTEIDELTSAIAEAESEREALSERIRSLRETIQTLRDDVETAAAELGIETPDQEVINSRREELTQEADDLRDQIEEKRLEAQEWEAEAETKRERAEELRGEAEDARETVTQLEAELESARTDLEEHRSEYEAIETHVDDLQDELADAPVDRGDVEAHRDSIVEDLTAAREQLAERRADLENARDTLADAEQLRAEGKCPECGQPVDGSPHVESISDHRDRVAALEQEIESIEARVDELTDSRAQADALVDSVSELERFEDQRASLQSLIDQQETALAEKAERIDDLQTETDEYTEAADAAEAAAETAATRADEARDAIGELNQSKGSLDERRDQLEEVDELREEITTTEQDIQSLRDRKETKREVNTQRRERLAEKRERKAELEDAFDPDALEQAHAEKDRAESYLDEVDPYLEDQREERDTLQNKIGAVQKELDELDALRNRRDALQDTVDHLNALYDEAQTLQETYADLRADLRQQNVTTLESLLNDMFHLLYQNDSYARIELDGDYELTVHQKDGTPLAPEQLSGGERALFNLSLRCAIYRLLSEGIDGTAPMPPLILDEPTVFLDSGHVSKLVELVESMTDHGVDQIIVVSHDDELVGAADELIAVRKDPTTNRTAVERSDTIDALP